MLSFDLQLIERTKTKGSAGMGMEGGGEGGIVGNEGWQRREVQHMGKESGNERERERKGKGKETFIVLSRESQLWQK